MRDTLTLTGRAKDVFARTPSYLLIDDLMKGGIVRGYVSLFALVLIPMELSGHETHLCSKRA